MLAVMRVAIRLPFSRVARILRLRRDATTPDAVDPRARATASEVGWAVTAAAAHTPWETTCLMQGLAAATLLRRRRIDTTLYLGVAGDGTGADGLSAHAWLRCGDVVLTGARERWRFEPIATFAVLRAGRMSTPVGRGS
jgi:hypothetical protein